MTNISSNKDFWDKISLLTPLLIGLGVTGVGGLFTNIYNERQLQLNQIAALDKLRPLLISEKPAEREFGYSCFVILGYEQMAIKIIKMNQDQSGRPLLVELQKSGSNEVQKSAAEALNVLNIAELLSQIKDFEKWDGLADITITYNKGYYDPDDKNIYVVSVDIYRTFKISYQDTKKTMSDRVFGKNGVSVSMIHDIYGYGDWDKGALFVSKGKLYRFKHYGKRWIIQ